MATTITKVDVWSAEITDEPGALDRILAAIANAGGNVECVIARRSPDKPGMGHVYITPVKGPKVQKAARAAGLNPATGIATLRIETPNKPGQGHMVMQAIADADVNVRGISAVAAGTKAIAYIGLDSPVDAARAIKSIKAADKPARKR